MIANVFQSMDARPILGTINTSTLDNVIGLQPGAAPMR